LSKKPQRFGGRRSTEVNEEGALNNPLNIKEIRIRLISFDQPCMTRYLNNYPVGSFLRQFSAFNAADSFAVLFVGVCEDGEEVVLHRSCSYALGSYSVQADAWSHPIVRGAGFHQPGLAIRIVDRWLLGEVPPEKILVFPQVGPDWTEKMPFFGFVKATSTAELALPAEILETKQPVFNLSDVGLELMLTTLGNAFASGFVTVQDRKIPITYEAFICNRQILRGISVKSVG
jgi:hypothetical protein